jgi:hypothetical protein
VDCIRWIEWPLAISLTTTTAMSVMEYLSGPLAAEKLVPILAESLGAHIFPRRDDVEDEQGLVRNVGFMMASRFLASAAAAKLF